MGARSDFHLLQDKVKSLRFWLTDPHASVQQRKEALALSRHFFERYRVFEAPAWPEEQPARVLSAEDRTVLRQTLGEMLLHNARVLLRQAFSEPERRAELLAHVRQLHAAAATCFPENEWPRFLWLQQAARAELEGQSEEAASYRRQAAQQSLQGAVDERLQAAEYIEQGRYHEATLLLEKLHEPRQTDFELCLALGSCYAAVGEVEKADLFYRQAMLHNPKDAQAYYLRGLLYLGRQYYEPASADFDEVLKRQPDHTAALYNRAVARYSLGKLSGALEDLNLLLRTESPPSVRGHLLRARIHAASGNREAARQDTEDGLRLTPVDGSDWAARAEARAAQAPSAALADIERAVAINPGLYQAWQTRAHILAEYLGRTEEAAESLNKVLQLRPGSVPALVGRGVLHARLGRRDLALADAKAALARDRHPATVYRAGCTYALTSRHNPADAKEALRLVSAALRQGYGLDWLGGDRDLDPIREQPEFRRLTEAARVFGETAAKRPTASSGEQP